MFDELVDEVTRRIEATEGRQRSRRQTDQQCFEHSVKVIIATSVKRIWDTFGLHFGQYFR